MESSRRPLNVLMKNTNKEIIVKLKNNIEYKGRMFRCDNYMNILLEGAEELKNSRPVANYGNIFIRGNNILYICISGEKLP